MGTPEASFFLLPRRCFLYSQCKLLSMQRLHTVTASGVRHFRCEIRQQPVCGATAVRKYLPCCHSPLTFAALHARQDTLLKLRQLLCCDAMLQVKPVGLGSRKRDAFLLSPFISPP